MLQGRIESECKQSDGCDKLPDGEKRGFESADVCLVVAWRQ
jgi:hypothetical protein